MLSKKAITQAQAVLIIVVIVVAGGAAAYFATLPPATTTTTTTTRPGETTTTTTTTPTTTVPAVTVPNPDTMIGEIFGQPEFLDPAVDYETAGAHVIQNVYEQLLFFKGADATTVVPWLVENYQVSPDGLKYTMTLRQGIKFHDGNLMTAQDVVFSILRAIIIDDGVGPSWALAEFLQGGLDYSVSFGHGEAYTQAAVDALIAAKPIEALDDKTVAFNLIHPYAAFPTVLAFSVSAIVSQETVIDQWVAPTDPAVGRIPGVTAGEHHAWMDNEGMPGSGPYKFVSWDKATGTIVIVRNDGYWGTPFNRGVAPIKNIIIKEVLDEQTRILDLKAGTADHVAVNPENLMTLIDQNLWFGPQGKLKSIVEGVVVSGPFPDFLTSMMAMNQAIKDPITRVEQPFQPFQDKRIRQAFVHAFDQATYVKEVVKNLAPAAHQIIPPGMLGYDPAVKQLSFDLDKAKALLLDAGKNPIKPENAFEVPTGAPGLVVKSLTIVYNQGNLARETGATLLASAINSLETGLVVQVAGVAWPQFLALTRARATAVFFVGWIVDYVDPDNFLFPFAGSDGTFSLRIGVKNATWDQWIEAQRKETDPQKRLQFIQLVNKAVTDESIYIWTTHGGSTHVHRTWITERPGFSVAPNLTEAGWNTAIYGHYYYELQKGA